MTLENILAMWLGIIIRIQSSLDDAQGKAVQGSKQASQGQDTAQGDAKTAGGTQHENDKTVSQAQAAPVADDTPLSINRIDVLSFGKLPYTDKDLQNQSRQVILTIYVNHKGNPTQVQIKQSTGLSYLDQLAVKAAQKARFKPHRVNGQAVPIKVDFPINFEMNRRGR
ncbi:energy transducer TonB family protein [Acinetobacter puyangensis]|uniref:energy transducer TonB family protein n=1 Tax=Acinetobacter puyangensis TaxID=1096779 RepID=UPI003A4DD10A